MHSEGYGVLVAQSMAMLMPSLGYDLIHPPRLKCARSSLQASVLIGVRCLGRRLHQSLQGLLGA